MLDILEKAALDAGKRIMAVHAAGPEVTLKSDSSPVTQADEQAEAIILAALAAAFPHIPVVAEEQVAAGRVPDISGGRFFLVDPLDGTKEFIAGRDDFTVNIALVEGGAPTAGIVYAPARNVAYTAAGGKAARLEISGDFRVAGRSHIGCRRQDGALTAVASRSHNSPETTAFLDDNNIMSRATVGSSLKFCLVAEGLADIYPRFSRTMEWDTAAGDAVLRAAGGRVTTADGRTPLTYGKVGQPHDSDFANPSFIGWGA